jgi:hypothetical protein
MGVWSMDGYTLWKMSLSLNSWERLRVDLWLFLCCGFCFILGVGGVEEYGNTMVNYERI